MFRLDSMIGKSVLKSVALLGVVGVLLASCTSSTDPEGESLKHSAAPDAFPVVLRMRVLDVSGNKRTVGIELKNPEGVPVHAIRSWIRFNTDDVELSNLQVHDQRLALFAPGENDIDEEAGLLKIGAALPELLIDRTVLVATFTATIIGSNNAPVLAFHDWLAEGDGHAAVLTLKDGNAVQVLQNPSPLQL